jgi:hypothetical protein
VSILRSYQVGSERLTRISETRLISDGQEIRVEYLAGYDGKEYPVLVTRADADVPTESEDTVAFRLVNQHTVGGVFRHQGNITSEFSREVSADGRTLFVRIKGKDSTGRPIQTLLVYDRLFT